MGRKIPASQKQCNKYSFCFVVVVVIFNAKPNMWLLFTLYLVIRLHGFDDLDLYAALTPFNLSEQYPQRERSMSGESSAH